jgi:hypothetical protein
MFEFKPDYEITKKRFDGFWERELLDRPLVQFHLQKPIDECQAVPITGDAKKRDNFHDVVDQAERYLINLSNQLFLGDTLPVACPSLGPAAMAAFYGCKYHLSDDGTGWNDPMGNLVAGQTILDLDWENPWLNHLHKLTDALLEIGAGRFIIGMSDWFTGGDCLSAILGPMRLAAALIENPDWVRNSLDRMQLDFERLYLGFHNKLKQTGQPTTTWVPLLSEGKYYVVANDFSTMVSAGMYRDIFLSEIKLECAFLDHSVYHLDGPDALRHLDAILELEDLDGVHFVPSPGNASFARWADVYRRIQAAGKCLLVNCGLAEVEEMLRVLKPEGLLLNVQNVASVDEAQALIHYLEKWPVDKDSKRT